MFTSLPPFFSLFLPFFFSSFNHIHNLYQHIKFRWCYFFFALSLISTFYFKNIIKLQTTFFWLGTTKQKGKEWKKESEEVKKNVNFISCSFFIHCILYLNHAFNSRNCSIFFAFYECFSMLILFRHFFFSCTWMHVKMKIKLFFIRIVGLWCKNKYMDNHIIITNIEWRHPLNERTLTP